MWNVKNQNQLKTVMRKMIDLLPSGSAGRRAGWWPPGVRQTLVVFVETLFYWSTVARGCETNSFAVVEMTFICNGLLMFCTKSSIPPSNAFDMIRREQNVFDTREWLTLLFKLTIEHDHHIILNIYTAYTINFFRHYYDGDL